MNDPKYESLSGVIDQQQKTIKRLHTYNKQVYKMVWVMWLVGIVLGGSGLYAYQTYCPAWINTSENLQYCLRPEAIPEN